MLAPGTKNAPAPRPGLMYSRAQQPTAQAGKSWGQQSADPYGGRGGPAVVKRNEQGFQDWQKGHAEWLKAQSKPAPAAPSMPVLKYAPESSPPQDAGGSGAKQSARAAIRSDIMSQWPSGAGGSTSSKNYFDTQLAGKAIDAYSNLGSSGMGAMGQYGSSVANSLANQSIAAGNTYGQMANAYYNTMGQLGQVGSALAAAGLTAGAGSASASGGGGMSFGGAGSYGGFNVSGPSGEIASGSTYPAPWALSPASAGGGQGAASAGGGQGGLPSAGSYYGTSIQKGATPQERFGMAGQGFGFLDSIRNDLQGGHGGLLAGLATDQFNANRDATMNPMFANSMNSMFKDAMGGIAAQSPPREADAGRGNGMPPAGGGFYRRAGTKSTWTGYGTPNKTVYDYHYIPPEYIDPAAAPGSFPGRLQIPSGR